MENSTLIRRVHMECPICDKVHEVEERRRQAMITMKGEEVTYEEQFYYCAYAEEEEAEFESAKMSNENLLNARNAYRRKQGLLTSEDIVAIREDYELSQVDLARLLGWGEATISRYESKAIQEEAYDVILRLIRDNPLMALEFLKKNEMKFSEVKVKELRARMIEKIEESGKEYLARQVFKGEYAAYDIPSDSNGYTKLDIDKLEAIISYFAKEDSELVKMKLMRMLWYSDVLAYERNGYAMTGLVYRHESIGALPVGHYSLMNLQRLNVHEEVSNVYDTVLHIYPNEEMDYSVIGDEEKKILDVVVERFKASKELAECMQEETVYNYTSVGAVIPFSLVKESRNWKVE
ncbi:MAG: type II toxin-antitoxin system MqsA family antitoxin [Clostridium sp.]|nr:type II toxin-antitoxin system MqsA family antitoxin [Clostridium sp.]